MNEKQATRAVARMYAAHGSTKAPEVVAELAGEALESGCGSCAAEVLETARGGKYPLTVQTYREAYQRASSSTRHGFHIGQDERQVDVGKLEADWRKRGVQYLVDAGMAPDRAQVAAAMQWASGITIAADDDIAAWGRHVPRRVDAGVIEAAWTYARHCATSDPSELTDDDWQRVVRPWERVFSAANAGASA